MARAGSHLWRGGRALVIGALTVAVVAGVVDAAITKKITVGHVKQNSPRACVAASTLMELKQIGASGIPSQSSLYNEGLSLKSCNKGVDNGLDPRAWAWLLYNHNGLGYSYDHVKYTTAYAGTSAMAWQLFYYGEVSGALVNTGHHAMVFMGATVSCDPRQPDCNETISTVYVDDPWYDRSTNNPGSSTCTGDDGQSYTCGLIGLSPGRAITYAQWKAWYYTKWSHQDCSTWNGYFVAVVRKSGGGHPAAAAGAEGTELDPNAPSDTGLLGPTKVEPTSPAASVTAPTDSIADLDAAFLTAKSAHGLVNRPELAEAINGHVRSVVQIRSLDPAYSDYALATIVGSGGTQGVALFTRSADGTYTFAEFNPAEHQLPKFPSVSSSEARRFLKAAGLTPSGTPELVWAPSDVSATPFYPMYQVATDHGTRYVSSSGEILATLSVATDQ